MTGGGGWDATFEARSSALAEVRSFVRAVCDDQDVSQQDAGSLLLVANELSTNCVLHGHSKFLVHLWLSDAGMWVELTDASDELPVVRGPGPELRESGRGLQIVDELAENWGVKPIEGNGKVVWAELRRT